MNIDAGADRYYFALRDLPGDASTVEAVAVSYGAAASSVASSDTKAIVRLYGTFDPVSYDSTLPTGVPRFVSTEVTGFRIAVNTTFDQGWWGGGDPPVEGPTASVFLLQITCAEEYDVESLDAYTSADGGQNLYIGLVDYPPNPPVSEIKIWRIADFPSEGPPDPFWTALLNAQEII